MVGTAVDEGAVDLVVEEVVDDLWVATSEAS